MGPNVSWGSSHTNRTEPNRTNTTLSTIISTRFDFWNDEELIGLIGFECRQFVLLLSSRVELSRVESVPANSHSHSHWQPSPHIIPPCLFSDRCHCHCYHCRCRCRSILCAMWNMLLCSIQTYTPLQTCSTSSPACPTAGMTTGFSCELGQNRRE